MGVALLRHDAATTVGLPPVELGLRQALPYRQTMPELSRFYGIIIRMFVEVGTPHHRPHFHAYYQDQVAIFSLTPVELIAGELPTRQRRLVEAWAELHEAELAVDWQLLQSGRKPLPIAPLT